MSKNIILVLLILLPLSSAIAGPTGTSAYTGNLTQSGGKTTADKQTTVKSLPYLSSPRETVKTFIEAMSKVMAGDEEAKERASMTFDLSQVSPLIRREKGEEAARLLFSLMQMHILPKLNHIPVRSTQPLYLLHRFSAGDISLSRDDGGNWRFSSDTVSALPDILDALASEAKLSGRHEHGLSLPFNMRLRAEMPAFLKSGFLLEYWQWLGLFLVIVLGSVVDKTVTWVLRFNVTRWQRRHPDFTSLDNMVLRPLGLMAMAIVWWGGLSLLGLPDTALLILLVAVKVLVSLSGIWSAFRIVDVFDTFLNQKALATENKFDDLLVPMISKSLKVFVIVIGVVFAADNLNIDVTSLLAGLGLGGLAFALAAKDLIGNFFGSLTVLLDRPFHIGDWVIIGDVEGMVEEVGFRSTRIRTFYNSMITLPNSILTTTKIDNMGARRFRRMRTALALTYDTPPDKIEAFCEGVRQLAEMHSYIRKDNYQVFFHEYGAASLDILVNVFFQTPDWHTELRERHRFLLDILRLAKKLQVEFAYPTQTLYLKRDLGIASDDHPAEMGQDEAFSLGQREAEAIVNSVSTTVNRSV